MLRHAVFDELPQILADLSIARVAAVLLDLGVSSLQLDSVDRGFAYSRDTPLDMRMDQTAATSALDVVNGYTAKELARVFREYGEERFASRIARRSRGGPAAPNRSPPPPRSPSSSAMPYPLPPAATGGHPAKRVFQALRIEVNDELGCSARMLDRLPALLAGRRTRRRPVLPVAGGPAGQARLRARRPRPRPAARSARHRSAPPSYRLLTRGAETADERRSPRTRGPRRSGCARSSGTRRDRHDRADAAAPRQTVRRPSRPGPPAPVSVAFRLPHGLTSIRFGLLIGAILVAGLVAMLAVNTSLAAGAIELGGLESALARKTEQQQALGLEVEELSSAESLQARAIALGMVPAPAPAFLDPATGKTVRGTACRPRPAPRRRPALPW